MSDPRGMPLLSGPPTLPPQVLDESCRKCNKELRGPMSTLFTRERRCNHCGYMYCSSCAPYTALMPRAGSSGGYDAAPVCSSCIEVLNITAAGRAQLKSYTAARLKQYLDAYNIKHNNVLEKSDLIDIIMKAKRPNGCMPKQNEDYFRKHSVPSAQNGRPRGFFERTFGHAQSPPPVAVPQSVPRTVSHEFLRPDLAEMQGTPDQQQQQQQPSRQNQAPPRPSSQPPQQRERPQHHPQPRPRPQQPPHPAASTPQQPPTAPPRPPPSPPPTLDQLLSMPAERISALTVSQLKAALFAAHVRAPPQALEKVDLVERVLVAIEDERRRREREAAAHAAEEEAAQEAARRAREAHERQEREREEKKLEAERLLRERRDAAQVRQVDVDSEKTSEAPLAKGKSGEGQGASPPPPPPPPAERTGLCVICQDEEACIAVVDCGHMSMCRGCADLVMASSRECPLCRTRIVTEARLLRIFKT